MFNSYANLELRNIQVLKGTLAVPSENAHVEVSWPNNVGVDELIGATPIGARVIVLADRVRGADESTQTFKDEQSMDVTACVRANLLTAPPYGLLVEGVDGLTYVPLWDLQAPLLVSGANSPKTFEGALAAIRAAATR